jgi:hypothetical protein
MDGQDITATQEMAFREYHQFARWLFWHRTPRSRLWGLSLYTGTGVLVVGSAIGALLSQSYVQLANPVMLVLMIVSLRWWRERACWRALAAWGPITVQISETGVSVCHAGASSHYAWEAFAHFVNRPEMYVFALARGKNAFLLLKRAIPAADTERLQNMLERHLMQETMLLP